MNKMKYKNVDIIWEISDNNTSIFKHCLAKINLFQGGLGFHAVIENPTHFVG